MMTPAITITLRGARRLIGYRSCSLLAARRARLDRAPGVRSVVGPYASQPPMNRPTRYFLKAPAKALLVLARAFDPAHDLFLPLVHAPGERVRVPLLAPPVPPPDLLERLAQLFRSAPWVEAVTYRASGAEHEYSRRSDWPDSHAFTWAVEQIQRYGHRERFRGGWWQAADIDGYHVWGGYETAEAHRWVNRRALAGPPVPIYAEQELIAVNARVLALPELPGITDPHQRLAITLFGGEETP